MPSWIGELKHLRFLKARSLAHADKLKKLPHLAQVWLDDRDPEALAELADVLDGKVVYGAGVLIRRDPPAAPKHRGKIMAALRGDTLADRSDLSGVKLAGETFEHLWITHDFSKANLAGTVWKHCDFEGASFVGADLTGAVFEDCYFAGNFGDGMFAKAKAPGLKLVWCGGSIELARANVRDAELYLEDDARLVLANAKADNATIACAFCSEREHQWNAKGASLAGARVTFDVSADRRAEIAKKRSSRFKWKQDHLRGAKLGDARVTYAPLAGPLTGDPIDPKGKAAEAIGTLSAVNASLWAVIADAAIAAAWRGNEGDDFDRALAVEEGAIAIGKGKGYVAQIGVRGQSTVWRIPDGILLADYSIERKHEKQLALRVAQWPAPKKSVKLGTVTVTSGALALLLPYETGDFKTKGDKLKVRLPNGRYVISSAPLGPTADHEDELGWYGQALRITTR